MELGGEGELFWGIPAEAVGRPTGFYFEVEAVFVNPPVKAWADGPDVPGVAGLHRIKEAPADKGLHLAEKPPQLNDSAGTRVRVLWAAGIVEEVGLSDDGVLLSEGVFQEEVRAEAKCV